MGRRKRTLLPFLKLIALLALGGGLWGCSRQTYPADRVKESLQEICRKEYGIENIQVKIAGKTIGVYLPMKKLFAADFREALSLTRKNGKVGEMEQLFQPAPEALEQVEDVLFSISRVLLSADLKLDFYTVQATDVELTGLQLVLSGYVDDIKRVRLWDISREEYRKRILHELRLNRAALWHRPVRSFFQALEKSPSLKTAEPFFVSPLTPELFESLFFFNPNVLGNKSAEWHLGELRSTPLQATQILVYVPLTVDYDPEKVAAGVFWIPPKSSMEYLFMVSFASEPPKIQRVIPLFYLDEAGRIQKVQMPEELDIQKDIESWEREFPLPEIRLGDFLAEQLTRRTQGLLFADERIRNTFEAVQLNFRYEGDEKSKNYFSLDLDLKLRSPTPYVPLPSMLHEDVLYLLNLVSREFVNVLRSYRFFNYEFLQLNLVSDPVAHVLAREDLELFRRHKADLQGLLLGRVSAF